MPLEIQYLLNSNIYLKKYLREHSIYYKNLIRNPKFIYEILEMMKKDYHLTFPDKLEKIKNNMNMLNTFMDIIN